MKCTSIAVLAALSAAIATLIGWPSLVVPQEQKTAATESAGKAADEHPVPQVEKQAIQAELSKKTSLSLEGTPLKEAVESIGRSHHLNVQLDGAVQKDTGIDPSTALVSLAIKGVSLRSALRLMLSQFNFAYTIRDGAIFITTKEKADDTLETTVYDVSDLVTQDDKGQPDFDSIIALLTTTVAPSSWGELGGPAAIQSGPLGTLVVTQTDEIQEQIGWMLDALRKAKERIKAEKFESSREFDASAAEESISKALNDKVTFEFRETSLKDVVENLRQQNHIELQIDLAALKEAGLDPSTLLVKFRAQGIPFRFVLRLMLLPYNLNYVIRDEVLLITTNDKASSLLNLTIYPVGDLLPSESASDGNCADEFADDLRILEDNVICAISPSTWSNMGGPGSEDAYGKGLNTLIVVSQTADIQEQIADFLAQLRQVHHKQQDETSSRPTKATEPESPVLRVYQLRVSAPNEPAMTPQEVAEVVKSLVEPKSWGQPDVYIRGVTGKLIVQQLPHVHSKIVKLLDQLDAVPKTMAMGFLGGSGAGKAASNGHPGGGSFSLPDNSQTKK